MSYYAVCIECKVAKLDPTDDGEGTAITAFSQDHGNHELQLVVEPIFLEDYIGNGFTDVDRPHLEPIHTRFEGQTASSTLKVAPFGMPDSSKPALATGGVTIPGLTNEKISMRPSWDEIFMDVAKVLARRGTCSRRQVGAVIVNDHRIIATGYNGAPPGIPHCRHSTILAGEHDPDMEDGHCARAEHAERNALLFADKRDRRGATIYITCSPCLACTRMMLTAGIARILYAEEYRCDRRVEDLCTQAGIELSTLGGSV